MLAAILPSQACKSGDAARLCLCSGHSWTLTMLCAPTCMLKRQTRSMCVQLKFEVTPAPADSATCTATLSIIAADAKFNRASPISALSIKGCRFGTFSRCRMCLYQSITVCIYTNQGLLIMSLKSSLALLFYTALFGEHISQVKCFQLGGNEGAYTRA
jgi:hypothetical protein